MVTGIETAGLILGALPLIISALEHYNDSLKPFKDFVSYEPIIERLACDLQTQRTRLKSTCELLLISLEIPDAELQCLLEDPTASAWGGDALVEQLKLRLQNSYTTFLNLLSKLAATFADLACKIGLDAGGQPLQDYLRKRKRYWRRFRTCLALQEHEALISQVREDNNDLHQLVELSLHLESHRSHRRTRKGTFRQIRDSAHRLHGALQSCWSCSCSAPHCAELRLEQRDWEQPPCFRVTFPIMKTSSEDKPSTWHETQIKSFQMLRSTRPATAKSHTTHCNAGIDIIGDSESTLASGIAPRTPHDTATRSGQATAFGGLKGKQRKKVGWALAASGVQAFNLHLADLKVAQAHPNAEQEAGDIKDLCSVLRLTRQQPDKFLLGQFTHDQDRYEVVSVSQQYNADNSTSTFHGLLVNHNHRTPAPGSSASPIATSTSASPPRLTKKARLKLAVILASTVLQLHTTPWLTNDWDGRNIFFRQGSLDCPYVKCACTKLKTPTAKSPEAEWGPIRNRSLFALGVLLLEMSLKSPLEHLKSSKQHQQPQQQHNDFDDFIAASQLVKDVADEEGKGSGYYDAVQACIYGNFGPKVKDLDLANDTFRQAVYEDVILPLERDLEYFCRGP